MIQPHCSGIGWASALQNARLLKMTDKIIRDIYYNNDTGYQSIVKTLAKAKVIDKKITIADVRRVLGKQQIRNFRPETRQNSYVAPEARYQIQCDVAYMTALGGKPFALVAIDSFSKKLCVVPMERVTAQYTAEALDTIFKGIGFPYEVFTDMGPEFKGAFAEKLQKADVKHTVTSKRAIFAERVIRTVKERLRIRQRAAHALNKNQDANPPPWEKYITQVVKQYNQDVQTSIGMAPDEAEKPAENNDAWKSMFSKAKFNLQYPTLAVGDLVRLYKKPAQQQASYRTTEDAWSSLVHEITAISKDGNGENVYKIAGKTKPYMRAELRKATHEELPPGPAVGGRLRKMYGHDTSVF